MTAGSRLDIGERHLVALGNGFKQDETIGESRTRRESAFVDHDGDVVGWIHLYEKRRTLFIFDHTHPTSRYRFSRGLKARVTASHAKAMPQSSANATPNPKMKD